MPRLNWTIFPRRAGGGKNGFAGLLPELIVSILGTVAGIVLTVGITYCSEKREREDMARKTVMLTIHNLDVSIGGMERIIDDLNRQDSIFNNVRENLSASATVDEDTLAMFVSSLYSHNVRPIDTSTEAVFSSNIETWKNIDDPRVIGRIANCYSIMKKCGEEFDRIEREKYDAFIQFYDNRPDASVMSDRETAAALLSQNRIVRILDALPQEINLLRQMTAQAKALNERNKKESDLKQEELDEIGNLL